MKGKSWVLQHVLRNCAAKKKMSIIAPFAFTLPQTTEGTLSSCISLCSLLPFSSLKGYALCFFAFCFTTSISVAFKAFSVNLPPSIPPKVWFPWYTGWWMQRLPLLLLILTGHLSLSSTSNYVLLNDCPLLEPAVKCSHYPLPACLPLWKTENNDGCWPFSST